MLRLWGKDTYRYVNFFRSVDCSTMRCVAGVCVTAFYSDFDEVSDSIQGIRSMPSTSWDFLEYAWESAKKVDTWQVYAVYLPDRSDDRMEMFKTLLREENVSMEDVPKRFI